MSDFSLERILRLEAIESIRGLYHLYGHYLDNRDWLQLSNLFATEGELIVEPLGRAKGRQAIKSMMEKLGTEKGKVYHMIGNPIVTNFSSDRVISEALWVMLSRTPDDRPVLGMVGRQFDISILEDGEWKFLKREGRLEIPRAFPQVLAG